MTIVAPCTEDMMCSKLIRGLDKDIAWVENYHRFKPLDVDLMKRRIATCDVHEAKKAMACRYLDALPKTEAAKTQDGLKLLERFMPDYPAGSHCAFFHAADNTVIIRKWDEEKQLFYKIDNPMGPAIAKRGVSKYLLEGRSVEQEAWNADARVQKVHLGERLDAVTPWHGATKKDPKPSVRLSPGM